MMMWGTASDDKLGDKKLKPLEGEDRISALPDSIIHHILSLLYSTQEAIQTCVLSKRWKNLWTGMPVLIFNLYNKPYECSPIFLDNALARNGCSKIQKLYIHIDDYKVDRYSYFVEKISFAIGKCVQELILEFVQSECEFMLPEFVFNHASLVRLKTISCTFKPSGKVNWKCLKALHLHGCILPDRAVDNILCGSPMLESLTLIDCDGFDQLVIVSRYMKKLDLVVENISVLEISCPNLEELYLVGCLGTRPTEFTNFPSLNHATLDFAYDVEEFDVSLPKKILQQLQDVKDLLIANTVLKIFSSLAVRASLSPPLLNNKCLTLYGPEVDENPAGIAYALQCSHLLEKLVINKDFRVVADESDLENLEGNYWSSNKTIFNCLASHLKFVDITYFSKGDVDYKHVLNFIEFLLKNAEVLEKLTVVFEKDDKDFMLEVSLKLLSFPRCSKHATIIFTYRTTYWSGCFSTTSPFDLISGT